jgi:protein-S-isoprenylcysteine O-methyltransferase Ste14
MARRRQPRVGCRGHRLAAPRTRQCDDARVLTSLPPTRSCRDRAGLGWLLAGYAGVAGFLVVEAASREPGTASSMNATTDDQDTTRAILVAYGLSAALPLLLWPVRTPRLPRAAGLAGLLAQAAGLAIRAWAMRTLGSYYSRTLRADGEQQVVVDAGPYRLLRHPGYTGSLLTWVGFALTSRSVPAAVVVSALLAWAYRRRIVAEEQLLLRTLPAYAAYSDRTKRLIPFVW